MPFVVFCKTRGLAGQTRPERLQAVDIISVFARSVFVSLAMVLGVQAQTLPETSTIVAVSGPDPAISEISNRVVSPLGLTVERFSEIPIPVADYAKYRAIVFAERDEKALNAANATWSDPENLEIVQAYLKSGGVVVFCHYGITNVFPKRSLGAGADLTGFGSIPDVTECSGISLTSDGEKWLAAAGQSVPSVMEWQLSSLPIASAVTSADQLATMVSDGNSVPFVTVNRVGKGRVYFFSSSLLRLVLERRGEENADGFAMLLRSALTLP